MLLTDGLEERRTAAASSLAPLAASLAADLDTVIARPLFIPSEKARMSRIGGQCAEDGSPLTFDPFSPREHVCPRCGSRFRQTEHYRMWIMYYQQWLAERAVHAAALHAVLGADRHRQFAEDVLGRYADFYDGYPNKDNVLGPSRLFFSTYLESIWLLQLCVALDLLETVSGQADFGARIRDRLIAPAAELIRGYDEGDSNRQVWNNAALMASARLLGDDAGFDAIVHGRSGLLHHLDHTLLPDGSWYEGENYHQFAHRGLWYGVQLAETASAELPAKLRARFETAFATPFLTALPDFTYPARRDSRYRVSLRQWRFAESCELGLARADDDRLLAALQRLYADDIPRGDTGRWRSAAESERNEPPTALSRADLGWRSLLCARADLPALRAAGVGSVLLEGQGLAIFRRDHGRLYAALDYGHSGGGHGHPDRLNVLLADGPHRWLDDPGTGSYVEPTLHWYRSSLAHNAPMFGGRQQQRVSGSLIAHEDRGAAGWVRARVTGLAPGSEATRTLVMMPDYLLDVLAWQTDPSLWLDLPLHVQCDGAGIRWRQADVRDLGTADGFSFVRSAERGTVEQQPVVLRARDGDADLEGWMATAAPIEIWRLLAPGPPGERERQFLMVRSPADRGDLFIAWSPRNAVRTCDRGDDAVVVHLRDGSRHTHRLKGDGWQVEIHAGGARSTIDLEGVRPVKVKSVTDRRSSATPPRGAPAVLAVPRVASASSHDIEQWLVGSSEGVLPSIRVDLGERHYRQSERQWADAGSPTATVSATAAEASLLLEIEVRKNEAPTFAPARVWNELDNERADINSDGVQLYVIVPDTSAHRVAAGSWLMVPEPDGSVRITSLESPAVPISLDSRWQRTADGYVIRARVNVGAAAVQSGRQLLLEVMVNEISADRERRRGQLVLSGGAGEFIYLQGDRHRGRWTTLRIGND